MLGCANIPPSSKKAKRFFERAGKAAPTALELIEKYKSDQQTAIDELERIIGPHRYSDFLFVSGIHPLFSFIDADAEMSFIDLWQQRLKTMRLRKRADKVLDIYETIISTIEEKIKFMGVGSDELQAFERDADMLNWSQSKRRLFLGNAYVESLHFLESTRREIAGEIRFMSAEEALGDEAILTKKKKSKENAYELQRPKSIEACVKRKAAHIQLAKSYLNEILQQDELYSQAQCALGQLSLYEANIKAAKRHYKNAKKDNSFIAMECGKFFENEGKLETAVEYFKKVAKSPPHYQVAQERLGFIYYRQDSVKFSIIEKCFKAAEKTAEEINILFGEKEFNKNNLEGAAVFFLSIKKDSNRCFKDAQRYLGDIFSQKDRMSKWDLLKAREHYLASGMTQAEIDKQFDWQISTSDKKRILERDGDDSSDEEMGEMRRQRRFEKSSSGSFNDWIVARATHRSESRASQTNAKDVAFAVQALGREVMQTEKVDALYYAQKSAHLSIRVDEWLSLSMQDTLQRMVLLVLQEYYNLPDPKLIHLVVSKMVSTIWQGPRDEETIPDLGFGDYYAALLGVQIKRSTPLLLSARNDLFDAITKLPLFKTFQEEFVRRLIAEAAKHPLALKDTKQLNSKEGVMNKALVEEMTQLYAAILRSTPWKGLNLKDLAVLLCNKKASMKNNADALKLCIEFLNANYHYALIAVKGDIFHYLEKTPGLLQARIEFDVTGRFKEQYKRKTLPMLYDASHQNIDSYRANLRLQVRSARRMWKNLQARPLGRDVSTVRGVAIENKHGPETRLGLEHHSITNKFSQKNLVLDASTYFNVSERIQEFRNESGTGALEDAVIAKLVRSACCGRLEEVLSATVKLEYMKERVRSIVGDLFLLLFSAEVIRNPSSIIIHQMALDLLIANKVSWKDLLASNEYAIREKIEELKQCSTKQAQARDVFTTIMKKLRDADASKPDRIQINWPKWLDAKQEEYEKIKNELLALAGKTGGMLPMTPSGSVDAARKLHSLFNTDYDLAAAYPYSYEGAEQDKEQTNDNDVQRLVADEHHIVYKWAQEIHDSNRHPNDKIVKDEKLNVKKLTAAIREKCANPEWFADVGMLPSPGHDR